MTPQMKKVRCCLLCTSIDDECCRKVGRLLNSSAITRIDEAISNNVVMLSATSSTVQLQSINKTRITKQFTQTYGIKFFSFIVYSGRIIAWQTAMKSQMTKQQIMLDLNMSSRS